MTTIITTSQALERWDSLPDSLREALSSETNSDFLWRTCQSENVPADKIYEVATIAGYVMMGFLHPEDVALEIVERLVLDRKTASDIQDALNRRIFAPLQADLEKAYSPLSKSEILPKKSQEVGSGGPSPKMVFDMVSSNSAQASLRPLNSVAPKPTATPPTPVATSSSQKPISAVLSSIPVPTVTGGPAQTTRIPSPSEGKYAPSSLTQAGWSKTSLSPTQSSASPSSEPAPIILHEDAKFSASNKTTDFHLARPGGGAQVSLEGVKSQPIAKPAVLELGSLPNAPAKTEPNAPKFTHYTQFQISTQPIDRHVTEMTAPVTPATPSTPKMPTPSVMPVAPKPPAPPQPAAPPSPGKVVKVNYP